ncbi:MAG TPA: tetratricopeptide repeat protein, partial [Anaeromyxobacteraceae bacterium]
GADQLLKGQVAPARDALRRALELRPHDTKALGLLGQACYKAGRFDEAADVYARLVVEKPVDASARVNLGLASLKARRHAEAVEQLGAALDLNPSHRKAMGYLGLAYLEAGDFALARTWFQAAGSEPMVARCQELIEMAQRGEGPQAAPPAKPGETPEATVLRLPVAEARAGKGPAPEPATPDPGPTRAPPPAPERAEPPPTQAPAGAAPFGAAPAPPAPAEDRPSPAAEAPPAGEGAPAPAVEAEAADRAPPPAPDEQSLTAFFDARTVVPGAVGPFALAQGLLTVAVRGEVLVRARGLVAARGSVRITQEPKRFRGKATDRPFGEGQDRMLRASGEGALLYRVGSRRLTALEMTGESGYFREDAIFAMEDALSYENGRVASRLGADLNLVHLRGKGRFLLASAGELVALPVSSDAALRVPLPALAGWSGGLSPRVVPLLDGGDAGDASAPMAVDLSGEGRVLVDPEAAPASASQA